MVRKVGNARNNVLIGSAGNDLLLGLGGDDILKGGNGADRLVGGAGNDRLYGGNGSDNLNGGAGNDLEIGGAGTDYLFGSDGDDTLIGGAGADFLDGSSGADIMSGGLDADLYRLHRDGSTDIIFDFDSGDKIFISWTEFAVSETSQNDFNVLLAFQSTNFHSHPPPLFYVNSPVYQYVSTTGELYYQNGGLDDLIAVLPTGLTTLTRDDFMVF